MLVRNYPRCVHENDYRSILLGLNYALLPSVNSLFSIYCATERALLNAELNRLARLHGDAFPFIDSYFVDNLGEGQQKAPTKYPVVVKVGSSCAGYGKMLIRNEQSFTDLRSVLMMGREYYTVESFKESLCDIRLTRVGSKSYAYKRVIANGADEWKRNTGVTKHEDLDMTPFYSNILDLAGQLFGGLDIVTVDLLVSSINSSQAYHLSRTSNIVTFVAPRRLSTVPRLFLKSTTQLPDLTIVTSMTTTEYVVSAFLVTWCTSA